LCISQALTQAYLPPVLEAPSGFMEMFLQMEIEKYGNAWLLIAKIVVD